MLKKYLSYLPAILPWTLVAVLYAPVFHLLYKEKWDMVDYGHAPFILPLALFIAWTKRKNLVEIAAKSPAAFYLPGFLLMLFSAFIFNFGWRWDYMLIQTISLIPMLIGLLTFLYGPAIFRPLLFPIFYLLLLVPPPLGILDAITLPMRHFASVAAEIVLRTLQYPVTREGLLLHLGGHEIFLGAPCSGFRSLITMLSLGLIYVYFNKGNFKKNLVLILAIVPLAIFGNVVRVLIITFLTYYFGSEVGQGFLHEFSGMVVFVIMLLGLMLLERIMRGPKK
jgi:exosortase